MLLGEEKVLFDKIKLKIINLLLAGLKGMALKLLFYQAKYSAEEMVGDVIEKQKFDMRNMKSRIKNILIHDQDIIDKRWDECQKCEFLTTNEKLGKTYNKCTKCGCFMRVGEEFIKIRVSTASCPVGKWPAETKFLQNTKPNGTQPVVK